jgi:hypothetical protein
VSLALPTAHPGSDLQVGQGSARYGPVVGLNDRGGGVTRPSVCAPTRYLAVPGRLGDSVPPAAPTP